MTDYIKRDLGRIIANASESDIDAPTWEEQKKRLKAVQTADVEPVRHGKWEEVRFRTIPYNRIGKEKKCSDCGKKKDKYVIWHYCPNCGAKMDEEVD